jgi:alkylhydroperoxidase family enzyme
MARIPALSYEDAPEGSRPEFEKQIREYGRMTNMKRTLAHSPVALRAYMEWYPLRAEVAEFLGDRATYLFAHAISTRNDCLICSTFFRRIFIDGGEDPDRLSLNERESVLIEFGRQLAADPNSISDELHARLAAFLTPPQVVALTAFGGLMIATNVFNNALGVDLEYLEEYRSHPHE